MKSVNLGHLTANQLADRFAEIGVEQDHALLTNNFRKFNELFDQKEEVEAELRLRPGDERTALLGLYDHNNMQVRLNAAKATLAVAPERARSLLQSIVDSKYYPQAGDAGMCLWNIERGIFKPD
jgi:hypothetical protein